MFRLQSYSSSGRKLLDQHAKPDSWNRGGEEPSPKALRSELECLLHELDAYRLELERVNETLEQRVIEVIVSDEGAGFDPAALESAESSGEFGLFSIRERLDLVGGSLRLEAEPRKGTRATVTVPQRSALVLDDDEREADLDDLVDVASETQEQELVLSERRIRVLLADDHEIVREGLASLLTDEPDIEVVGQASDGQEAVELAGEIRPDVVLMDVTMPRLDGIEATRQIKNQMPEIRVIGLSMHEKEDLAAAMREAGASAYLSKNGCCETLIGTIRGPDR